MATEVILPKVDMDMATGKISRWFAKEGEAVKKGDPLFEIETDKAAMEVDAPASGTLRDVTGEEGVDIAVGAAVAWIYAEGEDDEGRSARAGGEESPEAKAAPEPADGAVRAERSSAGPKKTERSDGPDTIEASGEGSKGRTGPAQAVRGEDRRGVRATPLARRLAREHGLDLKGLTGSGPSGRIQREDVERAAASGQTAMSSATHAPEKVLDAKSGAVPACAAKPTREGHAPWALATVRLRDGEGTPILLLHGFGSESASWRPLLGEIDGAQPVLGIDLPGHGASVDHEASDFAAIVSLVEETILAEGIGSCHLVGHSLGGAVAAAVAGGTACAVLSLLLLAPAGFGPDIDTDFAEGFAKATAEAPIRSWLRHLVADSAAIPDGFVRATVRGRADGRHSQAQRQLVSSLFSNGTQHFEVRSVLDDLAMPVKIVAGGQDRVIPLRHFTGVPGSVALHVFAGTGHMPQIERRAEVAKLLRELTR